ncbi:MAG TPA: L,D-transpeptidase [Anaerolineales bacterium]|jgi:lipoprotein-anchoring transpeptidase ErfK/SrfK
MKIRDAFSRRDFLKLGGSGLLSLLVPWPLLDAFPPDQQGRVISAILWVYDQPSVKGKRVKMYWRDLILPITNVTISDDEQNPHNRVWYEIGTEGFAYSANLQPVRTLLNQPIYDIPVSGALAEVTVPYTDALEKPDKTSRAGYRMYYETVHWVMGTAIDAASGKVWYQVLDDKWKVRYYAPAEHLRIIPDEELVPLSTEVPDEKKRIEVSLDEQILSAYEYDNPVYVARVATGAVLRMGTYHTPRGLFMTYYKRPTRHMAAGDITASGFDLPGVPWVMYITESGISLHGTYWHNDFGRPRSHGCINLTPADAKWLYRWTTPAVAKGQEFAYKSKGTQVLIQD